MADLTDEQCDDFRRPPGSFNDMVRAIYRAGMNAATPPADAAMVDATAELHHDGSPVLTLHGLASHIDAMIPDAESYDKTYLTQAAAALRARAVPEAVAKYRHHLALLRDDCTYTAGHVGSVVLNGHRMEIIRDALSAILSATDSEVGE